MRLFKAENNLDLHTDFRRNVGDQNKNSIDVSQYDALVENSSVSAIQSRQGDHGPKQAQISSEDFRNQRGSIPDSENRSAKDKSHEIVLEREFKLRFYNDLHE